MQPYMRYRRRRELDPLVRAIPPSPRGRGEWMVELGAALLVATGIGLAVSYWRLLPDQIPVHYGLNGQPDRMGDRSFHWFLPALVVVQWALLSCIQVVPQIGNYPWPITRDNAARQFALGRALLGWIKLEIVGFLVFLIYKTGDSALRRQPSLGSSAVWLFFGIVVATLAVFAILGRRTPSSA